MKVYVQLWNISRNTSQNEKCSRQKLCSKFKLTFCVQLFSKICAVDEMWRNMAQPVRPQMAIRRMRNARWITKATVAHSEYVRSTWDIVYHDSDGYAQAHCLSFLWDDAIPVTVPSSYSIGKHLMAKLTYFNPLNAELNPICWHY